MNDFALVMAIVLILAMVFSKLASRYGIPALLLFLLIGMIFGSDGIFKIHFDDYHFAQIICSYALLLIIFYGGFSTNWQQAKRIVRSAFLMSTIGTLLTALITGGFCIIVLRMNFWEGMLVGSVLSSTDAASVFSILKSYNLNFKHNLASLLEMESGSNDPISYLLTMICIQMMSAHTMNLTLMILMQFFIGIGMGILVACIARAVLKRIELNIDGLYPVFVMGIVLLAFELCTRLNGNGYICVYLIGIIIGNSQFPNKRFTIHFFDGISWLMQIVLFFTLGLLAYPTRFIENLGLGLSIALFITCVARPAAAALVLTPFHYNMKKQLLIDWVGFRGAASIAFSIMAVASIPTLENDLFHIVFLVSFFSVLIQGSLLPRIAHWLDLVETEESILKTFTDYEEGHLAQLYEIIIEENHLWHNKKIKEADIDSNQFIVGVKRKNEMLLPKGNLRFMKDDCVILTQK